MSVKRKNTPKDEQSDSKRQRPSSTILGISRSISACQRCRLKKIRCDQNFPRCTKCEKANVDCVGLDPATGREVPRSYVMHLEDRIATLEARLKENGLDPDGPNSTNVPSVKRESKTLPHEDTLRPDLEKMDNTSVVPDDVDVNRMGNISFARLVSTVIDINKREKIKKNDVSKSINDNILPAILPPKKTAEEFIKIYFAQANSQIPILHREEFIKLYFIPIYGELSADVSLASDYTAINASFLHSSRTSSEPWFNIYKRELQNQLKNGHLKQDPRAISNTIPTPQEYHRALYFLNMVFAIASSTHLLQYHSSISDSFKVSALRYIDLVYALSDQLEALQGMLLMTSYSLMRPTVPGVWYVRGTAILVCIDLGLHNEPSIQDNNVDSFTKDKRRRLFWCAYSLDRQICFYTGRPVGFPEECINTQFPSELDDALIVPKDDMNGDYLKNMSGIPTYKSVSIAFFKIRRLQAEVQHVLYRNSEIPRRFSTFEDWKKDIIERLKQWKAQAPKTQRKMNCNFNVEFFLLNYYHTLVMVCGLSPKNYKLSSNDLMTLQEASKQVIGCYGQLLASKSINYTWAGVHNLFTAGSCYLYAIYNSPDVRRANSLEEVRFTTQQCISVLASLSDRCDSATGCRQSFEMLSAAILKLRYNDNVEGYSNRLPTNEEIAKNQPMGYLNSNLHTLVEDLGSSRMGLSTEDKIFNEDTALVSEDMKSNLSDQLDIAKMRTAVTEPTPFNFEWISSDQSNNNVNKLSQIQISQNDMDIFFSKLKDQSPEFKQNQSNTLPLKSPNRYSANSEKILQDRQNDENIEAFGFTEGNESPGSDFLSFDEKNVFAMINKMPLDSIWDEFFTSSSTALQPPAGMLFPNNFDSTNPLQR